MTGRVRRPVGEKVANRIPLGAPGLQATLGALAGSVKPRASDVMNLRIGLVTAVEATPGRRVQVDETSTAWLNRSQDISLSVGDRVLLARQGAMYVVLARLSGEPAGPMIGTVTAFASPTPPPGWLVCDGSAVSRSTYSLLFALIGTTYGAGDGSSTFALPNLTAKYLTGTMPYVIRAS